MCYVCTCFTWTLDLFQRAITFCLTCCIVCVICFGLIITIIAGIALGYNYSLAEFVTHTKSDVTIYMRRGQFNDQPDIVPAQSRRMSDDDLFSSNPKSEYEEEVVSNKGSEPLAGKWLKEEDAREYALKLTKYKGNDRVHFDKPELREQQKIQSQNYTPSLPYTRRMKNISLVIPTTVWDSGNSPIILRKFFPLHDITESIYAKDSDSDLYKDNNVGPIQRPSEIEHSEFIKKMHPDINIRSDNISERKLKPISDSTRNSHYDEGDFIDEPDNNIVYKPV